MKYKTKRHYICPICGRENTNSTLGDFKIKSISYDKGYSNILPAQIVVEDKEGIEGIYKLKDLKLA